MVTIHHIFSYPLLGNAVRAYFFSLVTFPSLTAFMWVLRFVLMHKLKKLAAKTETDLDDFLIEQFNRNVVPLLYYGIFYAATRNLRIHPKADKAILVIGIVMLSFYGIRILSAVIRHALEKYLGSSEEGDDSGRTIKGLFPVINIVLWSVGAIFLLDNLGFNISAVVAGLGIGGIAVALAAQALLGDLFSYFAILIDKPFELGDSITLGEFSGTVEHIGIKTTRVKSVNGEQLIFANSDLTKSRVQNFKRLQERRTVMTVSVSHDTPSAKLSAIPEETKRIIEGRKDLRFDRAHLSKIGEWGYVFEIVYFIDTSDYVRYMDEQQSVYLSLIEYFTKEKIFLASPLKTIASIRG